MAELKKVKASMMNAVHDLPLLVARDEGFFRDQGLDVDIIRTPGSGQRDSDHQALRDNIFRSQSNIGEPLSTSGGLPPLPSAAGPNSRSRPIMGQSLRGG